MSSELPDRLSLNPKSPYYNEEILSRNVIGIRFNGTERTNVEEYCVSEGWIRVSAGRGVNRYGQPLRVKINGAVEPYIKTEPAAEAGS